MRVRFVIGDVGPPVATAWSLARRAELDRVQAIMRHAPFREDHADDWSPDMARECQGKTAAALVLLHDAGLPLSALRGYVVHARIPGRAGYWPHAVLIARLHVDVGAVDYVLDHNQAGVRTLSWARRSMLYIAATPWLKAEAA